MDLEFVDTDDGPDLVMKSRDLSVIEGFQTMVMLALFGGNVAQSTPTERVAGEQAFDWWGNSIFTPNERDKQMNSETERVLMNVKLNSSGRVQIENAVKTDLDFMKKFAIVEVDVTMNGNNRVQIIVRINQPVNLQGNEFIFMWDATNKELV